MTAVSRWCAVAILAAAPLYIGGHIVAAAVVAVLS